MKRLIIAILFYAILVTLIIVISIDADNKINNIIYKKEEIPKVEHIEENSKLEINCISQYPELPTGCEAVALTNVLNYYGFNLNKFYIVDNYLLYYQDDYQVGFRGNPYSHDGTDIFPKGLVDTANNFLKDNNSKLIAYEISKTSFKDLLKYLDNNVPVIIWITGNYSNPIYSGDSYYYDGYYYENYWDEHCVVITSYDDSNIYICDSINGNICMNINLIKEIYTNCGQLAMVIL